MVRSHYKGAEIKMPALLCVLRIMGRPRGRGESETGREEKWGEGEKEHTGKGCLVSRPAFSYLGIHFVNIVLASAGCNN